MKVAFTITAMVWAANVGLSIGLRKYSDALLSLTFAVICLAIAIWPDHEETKTK